MPRVKRGVSHVKRRRNLLKLTKGYRHGRNCQIKRAKVAALKAGRYAYRDRRKQKSLNRNLWCIKLNAALRPLGTTYSKFIDALKKKNVELDRKVLSGLAEKQPAVFAKIVESVK